MQIAVIGAGNVGTAVASAWTRAGHKITLGVRNPHAGKYAGLAETYAVTDVATAAATAEVIVLAVPFDGVDEAVAQLGDLTGRTVIDATNPLTAGPDGFQLTIGTDTSGGEFVASLAPGAAVFKALNHVTFLVMADTSGYPQPPLVLVAGDDQDRKPAVMALMTDLGFEPADAGPLRAARWLEPMSALLVDQAVNRGRAATDAFAYLHKR